MRKPPLQFSLDVQAYFHKEGRYWVGDCPAFKVTSQGRTEAKAMLGEALQLAFDVYQEQGKWAQVLREAARHLTSRAVPRTETVTVPVPVDLIAANHATKAARAVA